MLSRDPDARPTLQQIRCHPWVSKPRHHWRGRMPAAYHQPRMCWKGWNLWKCFLEIRALFFYLRACSWRKHISRNNKTGSKPSVKWDQLYSSLFSGAKLEKLRVWVLSLRNVEISAVGDGLKVFKVTIARHEQSSVYHKEATDHCSHTTELVTCPSKAHHLMGSY